MNLIDLNGNKIPPKKDPTKMGIEELLERQDDTGGTGSGLTTDEVMTVIVLELARVKNLSLRQSDALHAQERLISKLTNKKTLAEEK